jgi:putative ABC transport system permease protein
MVRGRQSAHELSVLVRRTLATMDPTQAVAGDATLGELIDANTARHRFNMIILLWFAVCAAVLAGTGIYGVVAESVIARKQEIAIRMALGAPRIGVVRSLVSKTVQFALLGEAVGLFAVVLIYRRISGLLYDVAPYNPPLLLVVMGFVFGVSVAASFWPAWLAVDRDSIDVG